MTQSCSYQLTSFEPIVEGRMHAEYHGDGWSLWLRHRHYAGLFTDCEADVYERLTAEELADVLGCLPLLWGPPSSWSAAG